MVTVVIKLKLTEGLIGIPTLLFRQSGNSGSQTSVELRLCYSADSGITVVECYVLEVVETAENRNFSSIQNWIWSSIAFSTE